ncbi:MAG: biotin-dependent carboxyltransferase family protein [Lachnospiraceae bacterium]|nr:biotin-dependent carboxyltransferase family protein [Lachnospiraceae bacterium]
MSVKVLVPGPLTTIQDLGRFGYQKSGIPCSGVMDQQAYRAANELLGNCHGEAVLEHTLIGGSYYFDSDTVIALTGADMAASLNGSPCPVGRPVPIRAGDTLSLGIAKRGCRTYLAAAGGFDVPPVLGSRSTNLKCGFGGYQGRALASGDVLKLGIPGVPYEKIKENRIPCPDYPSDIIVRVIEGPQAELFTPQGLDTFYSASYTVSEQSDRMGCRLNGTAIESIHGTDIVSDGIVFGSVQVTSSGQPIVLMADRQTTGGYAKIATVITEDLPLLAQARPGDTIYFKKQPFSSGGQL